MPVDVQRITEARKAQRDATGVEFRGPVALEQIADTLEAIRAEFVLLAGAIDRAARTK